MDFDKCGVTFLSHDVASGSDITSILTHLYRVNAKKCDISIFISVLKARGKCVLADVICYWKMTSSMALDGVTSFLRLNDVTNTRKRMRRSLSAMAESL